MAVYLITWDLNKEKPNYAIARQNFINRLNQYDNITDPGLDSVRLVATTWTTKQISDDLKHYIDTNDRLLVTRIERTQYEGWMAQNVWDWINSKI